MTTPTLRAKKWGGGGHATPPPDPPGAMPMILEYTYLLREVKVVHDGRPYQWQLIKSRYPYSSITKTVGEGIRALPYVFSSNRPSYYPR